MLEDGRDRTSISSPTSSASTPIPRRRWTFRGALWGHALRAVGAELGDDNYEGLTSFDLSPVQVVRTAEQAAQRASHAGRDLTEADLREAARQQNGSAIFSLARRMAPSARWNDLVVTAPVSDQQHELLARVRFAPQVLERWDMLSSTRRGSGIKALFCGPPAPARPSPPRSSPGRRACEDGHPRRAAPGPASAAANERAWWRTVGSCSGGHIWRPPCAALLGGTAWQLPPWGMRRKKSRGERRPCARRRALCAGPLG